VKELVKSGIVWCDNWRSFHLALQMVKPAAWDRDITALAHADSWKNLGADYARLYRFLRGVEGSTI